MSANVVQILKILLIFNYFRHKSLKMLFLKKKSITFYEIASRGPNLVHLVFRVRGAIFTRE